MKAGALFVALAGLAVGSEAFMTAQVGARSSTSLRMSLSEGRREFLSKLVAGATCASVVPAASAANYFGDKNAYPEVVKPENAVKDNEVYSSTATKDAVQKLRKYREEAVDLQKKLEASPNADLRAEIRKSFDISPLRDSLNKAGVAFDEDTQRGVDRIIRIIIQDTLELDEASKLKSGIDRSPRRLATMKAKLSKLAAAFDDILKFFSA